MIESILLDGGMHTRVAILSGEGVATPVWVFDFEMGRHSCGTESGEEDGLKLHFSADL